MIDRSSRGGEASTDSDKKSDRYSLNNSESFGRPAVENGLRKVPQLTAIFGAVAWRRFRMAHSSGFMFSLAVIIACFVLGPSASHARDLSNRLGIGFKNQFGIDLPGVAVQYYPGAELGLSATLGIDTQKNNSRFGFLVKMHRIVFQEENLNFYMGAGAGLISQEVSGSNESGFELMGFGGAEFFFSGLENLGFSFETGTAITSISSGVRFRTFGDHPMRAGINFYF